MKAKNFIVSELEGWVWEWRGGGRGAKKDGKVRSHRSSAREKWKAKKSVSESPPIAPVARHPIFPHFGPLETMSYFFTICGKKREEERGSSPKQRGPPVASLSRHRMLVIDGGAEAKKRRKTPPPKRAVARGPAPPHPPRTNSGTQATPIDRIEKAIG